MRAEVTQTPLAAALSYAARGWAVFPLHWPTASGCSCGTTGCENAGKHPRTRNGLGDATTNVEQVRAWWRAAPQANVGIRTGNGLVVVDIDPRHDGDATWEGVLLAVGGRSMLPDTCEVITGGGGRHIYLTSDEPVPNSANRIGPGVDVRGEGGYVVAPPSLHVSGRRYLWEASSDPADGVSLAPLPPWLVRLCVARKEPLRGPDVAPEVFPSGGRNHGLHRLASSLRAKGLSAEEILGALEVANRDRCVPPLKADEVAKIAESAARYAPGLSPEYAARRDEAREDTKAAPWTHPAAERRVVGSALTDVRTAAAVLGSCAPEDLAHPTLRGALETVRGLLTSGAPIDPVTVAGRMGRADLTPTLRRLSERDATGLEGAESAARIVASNARARRVTAALTEGLATMREGTDARSVVEAAVSRVVAAGESASAAGEVKSFAEIAVETWDALVAAFEGRSGMYVPTGLRGVDELLAGGLFEGQLITVAAPTGGGKTAFVQQVMAHVAAVELARNTGRRCLLFAREMDRREVFLRAACGRAGVSTGKARAGRLPEADMNALGRAMGELAKLPIDVHNAARATVLDVHAEVLRAKARGGCALVAVDYLQIMDPVHRDPSEARQLSEMTRALKGLATGEHLPVVCLSQLNRSPGKEKRPPELSDLHGSGSIEKDSDVVLFLHPESVQRDARGIPVGRDSWGVEMIVAKQRQGPFPLTAPLTFHGPRVEFSDGDSAPPTKVHKAHDGDEEDAEQSYAY